MLLGVHGVERLDICCKRDPPDRAWKLAACGCFGLLVVKFCKTDLGDQCITDVGAVGSRYGFAIWLARWKFCRTDFGDRSATDVGAAGADLECQLATRLEGFVLQQYPHA